MSSIETTPLGANNDEPTFADLGVDERITTALSSSGITHPFPIQAMTLPVALESRDIIGQAKTGTGKTLGFGIPVLEHVVGPKDAGYSDLAAPGAPQALIVLPTRELCKQVADDLRQAGKNTSARIIDIYGGVGFDHQVDALQRGVEIVVGTPGRLIDLMNRKVLNLSHVNTVVLDEADEMLDLGFLPDVDKLLSNVPSTRHSMLFSATMPGAVVALARRFMRQPTHIRAQDPDDAGATVTQVKQFAYRTHAMNKVEVLSRILQAEGRGRTIVFVKTKRTAARLTEDLEERGFAVGSLHGDLGQGAREQALRALKNGKIDVMVATDVAARGIDVTDVTHVINYQSPEDDNVYLHRIGRTARAGASGTAVTFVDWDDMPRWNLIARTLDLDIAEPQETYHTSDHLYADLGIPQDVSGRLPRAQRTRAGLDAEKIEDLGGTEPRNRGRGTGSNRSPQGRSGQRRRSRGRGQSSQSQSAQNCSDQNRSDQGGNEQGQPTAQRPRRQRRRRRVNRPDTEK